MLRYRVNRPRPDTRPAPIAAEEIFEVAGVSIKAAELARN
jgi:hypothetical protein